MQSNDSLVSSNLSCHLLDLSMNHSFSPKRHALSAREKELNESKWRRSPSLWRRDLITIIPELGYMPPLRSIKLLNMSLCPRLVRG
jgi:hypothetical protein